MKEGQDVGEKCDRLAELPEPLLDHILSYLTMKDVIRTSVLTKRWRFIWMYAPCLTFSPLKKTRSIEVAFINQSLLLHKASKVQKLNITFIKYKRTETFHVDSWIFFAWTLNVNQLYLDFSRCNSRGHNYALHDIIFSCSSLTVLAVKSCVTKLPEKIKLGSLKTLSFEEVDFYGGAINNMLSSCSILEDLSFINCDWPINHNLVVMNSRLKTLKIWNIKNSTLEVNAPFVVSFELTRGLFSKRYVIKRMESLRSANFVCSKSDTCHEREYTHFSNLENLEYLCHVKDLGMCSCYMQAMSKKSTQDCRGKHIMDFISFDVTCLRIRTGLMKSELPGIAYILSHSPNVEFLIISLDMIQVNELNDNFGEKEYWKLQEPKFVNQLCNLKDVKIYFFMKNPRLLESNTTDDVLAHLQNHMNFLRFLLKITKVMERMTITTSKKVNFGRNLKSKILKLLFQLTQELLASPRASQAAQISFN